VSFTPWPLYLLGNRSSYPLDSRLGGPQSRSGLCGGEKRVSYPYRESNLRLLGRPACSIVTVLSALFQEEAGIHRMGEKCRHTYSCHVLSAKLSVPGHCTFLSSPVGSQSSSGSTVNRLKDGRPPNRSSIPGNGKRSLLGVQHGSEVRSVSYSKDMGEGAACQGKSWRSLKLITDLHTMSRLGVEELHHHTRTYADSVLN
jgi:hypothetical protein